MILNEQHMVNKVFLFKCLFYTVTYGPSLLNNKKRKEEFLKVFYTRFLFFYLFFSFKENKTKIKHHADRLRKRRVPLLNVATQNEFSMSNELMNCAFM